MKKLFGVVFILLFNVLSGYTQFDRYFENNTLRIDYFHSGNFEHEYYRPDEFIKKPVWAGSLVNLTDTFNYGLFRIMVYDSVSDKLIYSRGYSSLFAEWRNTSEGKGSCGNFSETVNIPFPKETIKLIFQSRDSVNQWKNVENMYFNPKYNYISKPKMYNFEIFPLHFSGDVHKNLDIVILADGYSKNDVDKMKKDFDKFRNYILKAYPLNENANKVNIWAVASISEQSGINNPNDSVYVKTIVNTSFNTINSDRYIMTTDNKTLQNVLYNTPYDQIIIMCNTNKYGGGGIYNFYSTAAAGSPVADFLLTHEFGHAFAGLADEYYTSEVSVEDFYKLNIEPWEPNITTLINFGSKWKKLIQKDIPVPTPDSSEFKNFIGVFEGGGYMSKGVYRSYIDCTMKSIKYNMFCPVCSGAIQKMIDYYSH